jgi:hypothetical protein
MHRKRLLTTLLVTLGLGLGIGAATAQVTGNYGTPPRLVPYTGYLENNGAPVSGTVDMSFYAVSTQGDPIGSALWQEDHTGVVVSGGRFAATLGTMTGFGTLFTDYGELYVGLSIDGTDIGGQQRIVSAPYSLSAGEAQNFTVRGNLTTAGTATFQNTATFESAATFDSSVTVDGNLTLPTSRIFFNNVPVRQHLNLWNTDYGIGVQNSTQYFRTGGHYAWFLGGAHADNTFDPGGGTVLATLSNAGTLDVNGSIASDVGWAPGGSQRMRIVRGTIAANTTVDEGVGWSVASGGGGAFDVTFSPAFTGVPTVVCSGMHPTDANNTGGVVQCLVNHPNRISTTGARLIITAGDNGAVRWPVSFIAIGPG